MTSMSRFSMIAAWITYLTITTAAFGVECTNGSVEKRTGVVTAQGKPLTLVGDAIEIGEKAPDFTALDRDLQPMSLSDFAGKVRIITVFPSIDTEVCAMQTRQFNQRAAQLDNIQILSVSMDLPFALDRFCAAEGIDKVLTLSDHREAEFGCKYGFLIEERRLLARGTVIVDQDGIVRYVEYVDELGSEPDYDRAVAVARELTEQGNGG